MSTGKRMKYDPGSQAVVKDPLPQNLMQGQLATGSSVFLPPYYFPFILPLGPLLCQSSGLTEINKYFLIMWQTKWDQTNRI